jgi:hypothetical protein
MVRNLSRKLHQLHKIVKDGELVSKFASCILGTRVEPLTVVDVKVSQNDYFTEWIGGEDNL